jgi:hypothetical protein
VYFHSSITMPAGGRFAGLCYLLYGIAQAQAQSTGYTITATCYCGPARYGTGSANTPPNQAGCVPCPPQGYNYPYSPNGGGYGSAQIGGGQQYPATSFNAQSATSNFQQNGANNIYGTQQYGNGYGYQNGNSQSNFGNNFAGSGTGGQAPNGEPGYLPNYRSDQYTNPQRIEETRALNAPFYQG